MTLCYISIFKHPNPNRKSKMNSIKHDIKFKKFFAQHEKYVKNIQMMHFSLFAYCTNIASILSSYGTPAEDSYGAPQGEVIRGTINPAINPRLPNGGSTVYSASGDALRAAALNQNPFVESDVNPDDSFSAPSPPSEVTQTVYG